MADTPKKPGPDMITKKLEDLRAFWERFPKPARVLAILVVVLAIGAAVTLSVYERTNDEVLFSGLSDQDAGAIVEHLKGKKIPYKIQGDRGTILVPADQVHELRLELASQGIPVGGGVGFELFDQQRFGMTEFEERVSLRRALEGELSRTITRLDPIRSARVHLVMPKKSLLGTSSDEAHASVTVELEKGRELGQGAVQSIVHLVSSSVEGLNPDKVTVIDTKGRMLSDSTGDSFGAADMEYRKKYESDVENHLREMLDRTLGPDSSVVRVSADFDFSQKETTEEHYDPDRSVVRSEQRELETSGSGGTGAVGLPGTRSNLPGGPAPDTIGNGENRKREVETKNYEVDKVVNHIAGPSAFLNRVSVAVLVDGKNKPGLPFAPRTDDELKKLDSAVRSAIGFDARRGDKVEVQSVPFHEPDAMEAPVITGPAWWKEWLPIAAGGAVVLAIIVLLLSFRRRRPALSSVPIEALPFPRKLEELESYIGQTNALPNGAVPRQMEDQFRQRQLSDAASLMSEVRQVFMDESEGASRVLKAWLSEAKKPSAQDSSKEVA
jgi:flagellar M-ring protein FliF